jgi:hypothetical protein
MFSSPRRTLRRAVLVLPAAAVSAALIGTPAIAATPASTTASPVPVPTTVAPPSQGIIMRDGGICDPIRHMGC